MAMAELSFVSSCKALNLVQSKAFEFVIITCISVNAASMCVRHATMSEGLERGLETFNLCLAMIFTAELVVKLFALRWIYFDSAANKLDFFIVLASTKNKLTNWLTCV